MQQWDFLATEIQQRIDHALRVPYPPEEVEWLPIAPKDGSARGAPFADVRAYQERLDAVCGKNWSTTSRPVPPSQAGNVALLVTVTIYGRSICDIGEAAAKDENAYTSAFAQGFKRACSAHGCGRSFYRFPRVYGEFNAQFKRFTDKGIDKLNKTYGGWYAYTIKNMEPQGLADELEPGAPPPPAHAAAAQPAQQPQPAAIPAAPPQPAAPAAAPGPITDTTRLALYAAARAVFGEGDWDDALGWYCRAFTKTNLGRSEQTNPDMLDEGEALQLLDALTRNAQALPDYWDSYKKAAAQQKAQAQVQAQPQAGRQQSQQPARRS